MFASKKASKLLTLFLLLSIVQAQFLNTWSRGILKQKMEKVLFSKLERNEDQNSPRTAALGARQAILLCAAACQALFGGVGYSLTRRSGAMASATSRTRPRAWWLRPHLKARLAQMVAPASRHGHPHTSIVLMRAQSVCP